MSVSADGDCTMNWPAEGRGEMRILRFRFQIHKQEKIKCLEEYMNVT